MLPREIFLSHSSLDRVFVDRLVCTLRSHTIPVWFSPTNIVGAQQWHDEIGAALKRCDWFLIVLSSNAVDSVWVKRELMFALKEKQYGEKIVPVLLQECDHDSLSWTLSSIQMVDFTTSYDNGCRDLLRIWGLGFKP